MVDTPKAPLAGPTRPLGSPDIPQFHLPGQKPAGKAVYAPFLYGAASIQFADKRRGVDEVRQVTFLLALDPAGKTTIPFRRASRQTKSKSVRLS